MQQRKGLIRWNFLVILGIACVVTAAYGYSFFDKHVKIILERRLGQLNGAEVNIGRVRTHFLAAVIEMQDIEISNPGAREWNRVEFGRMRLQLATAPLLRGKIVVTESTLSDVRLNTRRKFVATTFPPLSNPVDMAKAGASRQLQEAAEFLQRSETPLETQATSPSLQVTRAMDDEVRAFLRSWQQRVAAFPVAAAVQQQLSVKNSPKEAYEQAVNTNLGALKGMTEQLKAQSTALLTKVNAVDELAEQDMLVMRQRFLIPELEIKDLANEVSTAEARRWIRFVESYYENWQGYFEAKTYTLPKQYGRQQGTSFRFPVPGETPSVWVKAMTITSRESPDGTKSAVAGQVTDLSSDPDLLERPLHLSLRGDFQDIKGLQIEAVIDHRKEVDNDQLQLTVASMPVQNRMLANSPVLSLGIYQAESSVNFEFTRKGNDMHALLRSTFEKVVYRIDSPSQRVKDIFDATMAPLQSVQIDGDGKGVYPKMEWTFASNLAERLKENLGQSLQKESAELQSRARDQVMQRLDESKRNLSATLLDGLRPVQETMQTMEQGWVTLADDVKAGRVPSDSGNPI